MPNRQSCGGPTARYCNRAVGDHGNRRLEGLGDQLIPRGAIGVGELQQELAGRRRPEPDPKHATGSFARRLATLDRLSGGRLLVGLGQGWMAQEFTAAGVPRARRGSGFGEHLAQLGSLGIDHVFWLMADTPTHPTSNFRRSSSYWPTTA
jgi:Luciferase-like monooxygenase